jgi:hypothetical protein
VPQTARHAPGRIDAREARGAPRRPASADQAAQILQLQRTAGNRAVTAMIQRFGWGDAWDIVKGPVWRVGELSGVFGVAGGPIADYGLSTAFEQVVASNRKAARKYDIPQNYIDSVKVYATMVPEDGKILLAALARKPRFHVGGWILDIQSGAEAMTLDNDVFCVKEPSLDTFVHELVHVKQYKDVGPIKFLANYFGQIGFEALKALILREEMDPFTASSYEKEGYALEQRFKYWREHLGT